MSDETLPAMWWWLSFADPDRPTGQHFLGVVVVEAPPVDAGAVEEFKMMRLMAGHPDAFGPANLIDVSHTMAVGRCHELGVNPGGQVVGWPYEGELPPPELRERLLSRDELVAADMWGGNVADRGGWENV